MQIARLSSNVILDEMSSAKCCLLFGLFFDFSTRRKTTLPCAYGNFSFLYLFDKKLSLEPIYVQIQREGHETADMKETKINNVPH